MPYSHFAGWVKRKYWSLSISCTIIFYAQLLSLLPLLLSSWHRPRLHDDAVHHEDVLSSLRWDCCSGHSKGEGRGSADKLHIACQRAGGEGQVRIPRYRGWTTLAPECLAWCLRSACSVQKQPVFFTANSLASPASSKHFLFLKKQGLIIHFWGYAKFASICSIWGGGGEPPIPDGERKEKEVGTKLWETKPRKTASREILKTKPNVVNRSRDRFQRKGRKTVTKAPRVKQCTHGNRVQSPRVSLFMFSLPFQRNHGAVKIPLYPRVSDVNESWWSCNDLCPLRSNFLRFPRITGV